jgi:hypothetical protein
MEEETPANVLAAMRGARFDEFTIRAASQRLTFSKRFEERSVSFFVETNGEVRDANGKRTSQLYSNPEILFEVLELNLEAITELPTGIFCFTFENGAAFTLADCDGLWDNVFSVRTVDWPAEGARKNYFFS